MKKILGIFALMGAITLATTGSASAKCYAWKKVCHPVYKHKTIWTTCYDKYKEPYQCKKTIKVKYGHKCKNKCVSWHAPKHYVKPKHYIKPKNWKAY